MPNISTVAFICVFLLISAVTVCPTMAALNVESPAKTVQDKYAAEFEALTQSGPPLDLARLSNLSIFKDAHIAGIDVTISTPGAKSQDTEFGLFAMHTASLPTGLLPDVLTVPADADVQYFVKNLTKAGYTYVGSSTSTVVSAIRVADRTGLTPMQITKAGLRWSPDDPTTLVGQSTLTNYTYTFPSTGSQVNVQVLQPTTATGTPTGPHTVALSPVSVTDGTTVEWIKLAETLGVCAVTGAYIGLIVYGCWGAVVTGETIGLITGAAVGLSVAACAAIGVAVFLVLLVICLLVWYCCLYDPGPAAYFAVYSDQPDTKIAVHNTDGAIVYDDGSVAFLVDPVPPPLPVGGGPWVQATRTAAINKKGELWVLDNTEWTKYASGYTYTGVATSGSWFSTVAVDAYGTSHLEIPTVGSAQPAKGTAIQHDVDLLNAGIDPKTNNHITPEVFGWKEFVPGVETSWYGPYGLALSTDGRIFCVGSNRDGQCDLPGRYTHVATSIDVGWFSSSPYSIGIRASDGGLDFAGDNWFAIKDDITTAGLTNIADIAAGPDRAIARTKDGGLWVFGETSGWHKQYSGPANNRAGNYTTISAALPTDDGNVGVFIATTTEPLGSDVGRTVTRTPTGVIATTSLESPLTPNDLTHWQTDVMASSPAPVDGGRVIGIPVQDSMLDPIVAYGIRVNATSGRCEQFVGRAAAKSDVAPVHALLTAWNSGEKVLDAYLDRTYPFDPFHTRKHADDIRAGGHEPDSMTTVWSATTVSSAAPTGMVVGQYWLDRLIANTNWSIYALETAVMPIPGSQAFSSGYITKNADVAHNWTGAFAKYDGIYNTPYESNTGPQSIHGSLALSENTDYHYQYSQSPASLTYLAGFIPGGTSVPAGGSTTNTVAWSMGYSATDPSEYRGTFNPVSVVAAKMPSNRPFPSSPLALASIDIDASFTIGGLGGTHMPHDSLRVAVLGGATP
jgi:hypothetical protein